MMKKTLTVLLTAALVLSVGTADAFAVNAGRGCGRGGNYVDANGDGICDNAGIGCAFVDENGDGICDNAGSGCYFVDGDGDGVCDRRVQNPRPQNGTGRRRGGCGRRGLT